MSRRLLASLTLFALAFGGASCSLGEKELWADALKDADKAARSAGTAKVHGVVAVRAIETNIRVEPKPAFAIVDGVVDFTHRRARVVISAPRSRRGSAVVFDDLETYLPRSEASTREDPRPWARFDFEREPSHDIDANDRRLAIGVGMVSPALAVELLEGVLAGSIERPGTPPETGPAGEYAFRLAPDAAVRDLRDDERAEGVLRVFQTLGVNEDIFPGSAFIDEEGRPIRIRYVLKQHKDRVNVFEMRQRWDFSSYGTSASIDVPDRRVVKRATRFRDFVVEFIRETT